MLRLSVLLIISFLSPSFVVHDSPGLWKLLSCALPPARCLLLEIGRVPQVQLDAGSPSGLGTDGHAGGRHGRDARPPGGAGGPPHARGAPLLALVVALDVLNSSGGVLDLAEVLLVAKVHVLKLLRETGHHRVAVVGGASVGKLQVPSVLIVVTIEEGVLPGGSQGVAAVL